MSTNAVEVACRMNTSSLKSAQMVIFDQCVLNFFNFILFPCREQISKQLRRKRRLLLQKKWRKNLVKKNPVKMKR